MQSAAAARNRTTPTTACTTALTTALATALTAPELGKPRMTGQGPRRGLARPGQVRALHWLGKAKLATSLVGRRLPTHPPTPVCPAALRTFCEARLARMPRPAYPPSLYLVTRSTRSALFCLLVC